MTATHVNGVRVIESAPAASPLSKPGKPVHFKQVLHLLLEDDTETYGCLHCDYTAAGPGQVRAHLAVHTGRRLGAKPGPRPKKPVPADLTLSDLLERVRNLDRVTTERDEWKRRAKDAERKLAALRKALTP